MDPGATAVPLAVAGLAESLAIYVHGEQDLHVSRRLREEGIWEPYESSLVLNMLGPGQVFVDVGANIGYFSLLAASRVGASGAVFAFEPDPDNYSLLTRSAALNSQQHVIHATQAGLAAADGEARLYLSDDNLGDHQIFQAGEARRSTAITVLNGANFLGGKLQCIDLLKIDTQGSEFGVVQGLMPLLTSMAAAPRIIIELTPLSLRQCGSSGRMLIELLSELGQPMWIIDHLEHRLVASSCAELAQWSDNVDAVAGDAGFMNILVGKGLG